MSIPFRHSAGFGKRIEYWVVGIMLKQGMDVYLPLVDDDATDAVIKTGNDQFVQVQIKARSKNIKSGDGALFSAIPHKPRKNYYFVFTPSATTKFGSFRRASSLSTPTRTRKARTSASEAFGSMASARTSKVANLKSTSTSASTSSRLLVTTSRGCSKMWRNWSVKRTPAFSNESSLDFQR